MNYENMEFDVGLIGNGFDLNCGLKTNYSDFFEMVKLIYKSSNFNDYKDRLKYKFNEQFDLIDLVRKNGADDLYNLLAREYHNNYFVKYFLNYNSSFGKWTDFESELKNIIDCFYDLKKFILDGNYVLDENNIKVGINNEQKNLDDKYYPFKIILPQCSLYEYNHDANFGIYHGQIIINGNFHLIASKKVIRSKIIDFLNNDYVQYFYNELIAFENLFVKYLQAFVEPCVDKISLYKVPRFNSVITYNYTKTFEGKFLTYDICHIHGTYSLNDNNILFGIDSKFEYGDNFDWFLKANRRLINATDYSRLKKLLIFSNKTSRSLAIFGHSLNIADEDTLKFILKHNWTKIIVFFPNNVKYSKENLCKNLRQLLGGEMFENNIRDNVLSFQEII